MTDLRYVTCTTCQAYAENRRAVLVPAMGERRAQTGETSTEILNRYMAGVHHRHTVLGLSLEPR